VTAYHRAALFLLVAAGCRVVPPTPPDVPAPSPATACARGRALGCSWAQTTPGGRTCEAVLTALAELQPVDLGCLSTVPTCDAEDRCGG